MTGPGLSNPGAERQNLLISGPPDIRCFRISRRSVRRASGGSSGGCQDPDPPENPEISDIPPDFGLLKTVTSGGRLQGS